MDQNICIKMNNLLNCYVLRFLLSESDNPEDTEQKLVLINKNDPEDLEDALVALNTQKCIFRDIYEVIEAEIDIDRLNRNDSRFLCLNEKITDKKSKDCYGVMVSLSFSPNLYIFKDSRFSLEEIIKEIALNASVSDNISFGSICINVLREIKIPKSGNCVFVKIIYNDN